MMHIPKFIRTKLLLTVAVLTVLALVGLATTHLVTRAESSQETLDFEDLSPGTVVTTQYGAQGVLFRSAFVDTDSAARSGTQVLRADDPGEEFHTGPFFIDFTSPQRRVRLFAGGVFDPSEGTLRAYDASDDLVAQDGPKTVAGDAFTTEFEVSDTTATIVRVELEIGVTATEAMDDLEFEGEEPPPVPTEPPVVEITNPDDGAALDTDSVTVQGTVTGDGLYGTLRLRIEWPLPPDSTAPPSIIPVTLSGTGQTRTFELPLLLGIGPHAITAVAENIGSLSASDSVAFTNLPAAIRTRYEAEGGSGTFGSLSYGSRAGDCTVAVYEQGAIVLWANTNATYVVQGSIFDKWFGMRQLAAFIPSPGCPIKEERDAPAGARAQDFVDGRIYSGLPTGEHYVPGVFVDAIDTLGGESATGVPIADPTDASGVMQTWLFQQFTRPDYPDLLPSTLEIRGSPPVLWVERQGGDLSPTFFEDVPIGENTPTIWQSFPCQGFLGPCDVQPPSSGDPLEDPGDNFCDGTVWPFTIEWAPVVGDYELTEMLGIVTGFSMAGIDNGLTHQCGIPIVPDPISDYYVVRSDLNTFVRPLHPYRNLFANNREDVEIEFEYCWFHRPFAAGMEPRRGDLLFTAGRWIIDCGHDSYNSEIHPPAVLAPMRTVSYNGRPATRADIWVNGVYTGDPVDVEIYPPPRPSPNALLNVVRPLFSQAAAGNISVDDTTPDLNHVRVRFSAPERHVQVTTWGEMKWQNHLGDTREYRGRWHVYWTEQ